MLRDDDRSGMANAAHGKNPRRIEFLHLPADAHGSALDVWGSPYVITLDVDRNNLLVDDLYRWSAVTAKRPGSFATNTINGVTWWTRAGQAMAWSKGPDKQASPMDDANAGVNKDNVVGW
jgi:hypothetical protein